MVRCFFITCPLEFQEISVFLLPSKSESGIRASQFLVKMFFFSILDFKVSFQQTESNLVCCFFFLFFFNGIFCVNPLPGAAASPNARLHGSNISTNAMFEDLKHFMAISRSLKRRAIGGLNTEDQMSSES